jgi:hypothetical protein
MMEELIRHSDPRVSKALSEEEIQKRFGFHKATIEGPDATQPKHAYLRRQFTMFSEMLSTVLESPSREASLAFTKLEEASMYAHKAIAATAPLAEEDDAHMSPVETRIRNMQVMAPDHPEIEKALKVLGLG